MAKLDFYYDTQKVNEDIANWRDLEIEVNFEDEDGQSHIRSGSLEFVGALADKINKWNKKGMTGGPGIFEAPPFSINVCNTNQNVFNGGINTADCSALYECDKVVAPLRGNRVDFLNDRASSFSFAYLASLPSTSPGHISQSDYVLVPYVINSIPDYVNIITSIVSLYVMIKELQQAIEKTGAVVVELVGDIAPTAGVGVTIAVGAIIADVFKLILYLAYVLVLVIAIVDLTQILFLSLIQPIKYKKGIRVVTLFQKACDYLGFAFSSSILQQAPYNNMVVIPKKTALLTNSSTTQSFVQSLTNFTFKIKQYDDSIHPSTYGYFEGTFADIIATFSDVFNAKVTIKESPSGSLRTLYFERIDKFSTTPALTLPNIKLGAHGYNACELAANYFLTFSLDDMETNTYDLFEGTNCQHILSPIVINNNSNVLLKNLEEVRLIFSRAKRKETNTAVEDIFNIFYDVSKVAYEVFKFFCDITITTVLLPILIPFNYLGLAQIDIPQLPDFPANPVGNRIGAMLLNSDFIGVPKLLIVDSSNKVSTINEDLTSAQSLIDNFHFINFALTSVNSQGVSVSSHNQWLTYVDKEIPFCCGDYLKVLNNSYVKTYDQELAKIKSLVWNPYRETAIITFRVKKQYTKNLKEDYLIAKN